MQGLLVIHQSADLYGSDRALLTVLRGLDKKEMRVLVLLPCTGPLLDALRNADIEAKVVPLAILGRYVFTMCGFAKFIMQLFRSVSKVRRIVTSGKFDIIYSNTLAVVTGAFVARIEHKRHLWHVHELPPKNLWQASVLRFLLTKFSSDILCNSYATRDQWLSVVKREYAHASVVWNGIAMPVKPRDEAVTQLRDALGMHDDDVLISCVGRIKDSKGQLMLLQVAELMWSRGVRGIHFLFVGSPPPSQQEHLAALQHAMRISIACPILHHQDFQNDIWPVWAATDIAVIPSLEPESFGLVAIEAMAMSCPVVAAAHGGVMEIVEDGLTGRLVLPGDVAAFADALTILVASQETRYAMGDAGLKRYIDKFTEDKNIVAMNALLQNSTPCADKLA